MKRSLVFVLLGPSLAVLTVWVAFGAPCDAFVAGVALLLFFLILPVSAITGLIDGYLARALPVWLRAPLTAVAGTAAAIALPAALLGPMPQDLSMPLAFGGAFCMGTCSLLAHDYRNAQPGDVGCSRPLIV